MDTKMFYFSKTFWINVIGVIAMAVPSVSTVIQPYFTEVGIGWGIINIVLRLITKKEVTIS